MEFISKIKSTMTFMTVVYFIVGIVMIIFPDVVSDFICYIVALLFLFLGISGVVSYIKAEIKGFAMNTILIVSILMAALGAYIFLNPKIFASFIPLVIGIFLLVDAISKLSAALDLKKIQYKNWWHLLIVSLVVFICGLLLVFNPFGAVTLGITLIGILLIVDAISNIFAIYSYSKAEKNKEIKAEVIIK